MTCRRVLWAQKYQTEKVNLIYDKYGYKMVHNDVTRTAIQSDKIFVRLFLLISLAIYWTLLKMKRVRALTVHTNDQFNCYKFFSGVLFLNTQAICYTMRSFQCSRATSHLTVKSYEIVHIVDRCV